MSPPSGFPPAGASPYPDAPQGPGFPPHVGTPAVPGWMPAPQPGVIPLRPLSVGDLFEGTFRSIRANPTVMFGFSVAVMAIVSLISALVEGVGAGRWIGLLDDPQGSLAAGDELTSLASSFASLLVTSLSSAVLTSLATMVLSGMLALTVSDAVLGTVTPLGGAWARVRPRLWPLIGVTLLTGLIQTLVVGLIVLVCAAPLLVSAASSSEPSGVGIALLLLGILLAVVASLAVQVFLAFSATVVVLEGAGPIRAIGRAVALARPAFWRIVGRLLLITLLTSVATGIIGGAVGMVSGLVTALTSATIGLVLGGFFTGVVSGFVVPISASFTTLMYTDERIRQENLAPVLMRAAQTAGTAPGAR